MREFFDKKNVIPVISLVMIVIIVLLNIRIAIRFENYSDYLILDKLEANVNSLNLRLEESEKNTVAAAVSMSQQPEVINAVKNRDREEIIRVFTESYQLYQVNFYTVTDENGIVLGRTHAPDTFGDSVINPDNIVQQNVIDALNGKVSTYFEEGTVVKVSVRTGAPVYDENGNLIGVISAGVRFDTDDTVNMLSDLLGADVTVFHGRTRIATTLVRDGERVTGTLLDDDMANILLNEKREYLGEATLFGELYETYYKPLLNADNEAFAILVLGINVEDMHNTSSTMLIEVVLIGIMCVAISVILLRALHHMTVANKAKTTFLSTMSHEIRTPMNAIMGITEMLLQNERIQTEEKIALDKIHSSCDLLLGIINDILDLSKIEAGKLEILPAEYETASLINDTTQLNMMRIGSKPIRFVLDVDEKIPAKVVGDELRVKQILNNLLSNAFKYTKEGRVTLTVDVKKQAQEGAGIDDGKVILVFKIKDTGQGMTEEQINKLGNEYSRFNEQANRTTEGTGLGIKITKNLVNMMGGNISVESRLNMGTTFTVELPQGIISADELGREIADNLNSFRITDRDRMKRAQIQHEYMPYGKIMVVDDVETNIFVARGLLAPYGLKIDSAESGYEAIDILKNGNVYDIIFMDHMMPKMDGMEATRRIRETGYTAPIVALTANAVSGQAEMFLSNGFDDFISKPIDMRQMNSVLKKFIRDKQPPEVLEAARAASQNTGREKQADVPSAHRDVNDMVSPRVIEAFKRDATKALGVMEDVMSKAGNLSDEDLQHFTVYAHGLKAVLMIIGKEELSEKAKCLETMGREKNSEEILKETPAFIKDLKELIDRYK